jgi:hypothetical protein
MRVDVSVQLALSPQVSSHDKGWRRPLVNLQEKIGSNPKCYVMIFNGKLTEWSIVHAWKACGCKSPISSNLIFSAKHGELGKWLKPNSLLNCRSRKRATGSNPVLTAKKWKMSWSGLQPCLENSGCVMSALGSTPTFSARVADIDSSLKKVTKNSYPLRLGDRK